MNTKHLDPPWWMHSHWRKLPPWMTSLMVLCFGLPKTSIDPDVLAPWKSVFLYQPVVFRSMLVFQGVAFFDAGSLELIPPSSMDGEWTETWTSTGRGRGVLCEDSELNSTRMSFGCWVLVHPFAHQAESGLILALLVLL